MVASRDWILLVRIQLCTYILNIGIKLDFTSNQQTHKSLYGDENIKKDKIKEVIEHINQLNEDLEYAINNDNEEWAEILIELLGDKLKQLKYFSKR